MTTNKKPVKKTPAKKASAQKAAPKKPAPKAAKKDDLIDTAAIDKHFVDAQKFVTELTESVNTTVAVAKKSSLWKRLFGNKKKK
jgi:hypothetical protein